MNVSSSVVRGPELTNDIVANNSDVRALLERVAAKLTRREYDAAWKGATGYFDPMVRLDLNVGEGFTCVDASNRLMVVLPGETGNIVYFERYGDKSGPICCNGFSTDLAPSWTESQNRSPSGYCADNDQFVEPLLRRA